LGSSWFWVPNTGNMVLTNPRKTQLFATVGFEATPREKDNYRHRRRPSQPEQKKRNDMKQLITTLNKHE
jgi:hypothetical protein